MRQRDKFIVLNDYDWTLADTTRSSDDLWSMIADLTERPFEEVRIIGEKLHPDERGGYDYDKHIELIGRDREEMWERLAKLCVDNDYLYPGASEYVQANRADGYSQAILSFGVTPFQREKIIPNLARLLGVKASPLLCESILPVYTTLDKKGDYIRTNFPGMTGVLLDDRRGYDLPEGFTEIHYAPESSLTSPEKWEGGFTVANYEQAREVIHAIHPV